MARGAVTPSCPDALICVRATFCYLLAFLLKYSCVARAKTKKRGWCSCQNAKKRPCCLRPGRQTTVADAVNSRAPTQPTHIALALRSETSPTFVLAWQRNRSANNGMLLPHHISPPILAPPCSCFASAYRIRLRQRCLIIATRPRPVCSESTVVPLSPLDRIPV